MFKKIKKFGLKFKNKFSDFKESSSEQTQSLETRSDRYHLISGLSFEATHFTDIQKSIDAVNQLIATSEQNEKTAMDIVKALPHSILQQQFMKKLILFIRKRKKTLEYNNISLESRINRIEKKITAFDYQKSFQLAGDFLAYSPTFHRNDINNINAISGECVLMSARATTLFDRHAQVLEWVKENKSFHDACISDNSFYLSDLTPSTLLALCESLDHCEKNILTRNENKCFSKQLADIARIREEIAISMYERLCVAKKKCWSTPADLIALHLDIAHSNAYTLSNSTICRFFEYIEKRGSALLQSKLTENVGSALSALSERLHPFHIAMTNYGDAKPSDIVVATKDLSIEALWLPKENDYQDNAAFCAEVEKALLPRKIIDGEWVANIKLRKIELEKKKLTINNLALKIKEFDKTVKCAEKNYKKYQNSHAVVKFFRCFFGKGGDKKRQAALSHAKFEYEKAINEHINLKNEYRLSQEKLKKHTALLTQHIIKTIDTDLSLVGVGKKPSITEDTIIKIKNFIKEYDPALLPELNKKIDFTTAFFEGISDGASLARLSHLYYLVSACQSHNRDVINRLLCLLKGESVYDSIDALKIDISALCKFDDLSCDCMLQIIKERYLNGIIERKLNEIVNDQGSCNFIEMKKIKSLLVLYTLHEQESLLRKITSDEPIQKNQKSLKMLYCLPLFSSAKNYSAIRDEKLRLYFVSRMQYVFQNMDEYNDTSFITDDALFAVAENTLLPHEKKSIIREMLDQAIQHHLNSDNTARWNTQFSTLVEKYASIDSINAYRTVRLNELINNAHSDGSKSLDENAFFAFLYTCKKPLLDRNNLTSDQKTLIEKISSDLNASWMHEIMVRELGTSKQLQDMHCHWILTLLSAVDNSSAFDGGCEKMLRLLLEKTSLENFVGMKNMLKVKKALSRTLDLIDTTLFVPTIYLDGEINKIPVSREQIDQMIRIIGGSAIEKMIVAFSKINEKNSLSKENIIARWVSQRNFNVMTKQYYQVINHALAKSISKDQAIDFAVTQTILLQRPQDRQNEKEGRIAVLLSMQNKYDRDTFEDAILMSDSLSIKNTEKFGYNYHENPDIFYTHYRLPLLDFFNQLLSNPLNNADIEKTAGILEVIAQPLFLSDERLVQPIISILKKQTEVTNHDVINTLGDVLIRLSGEYENDVDQKNDYEYCQKWLSENDDNQECVSIAVKAVSHYINACQKAHEVKNKIKSHLQKEKYQMIQDKDQGQSKFNQKNFSDKNHASFFSRVSSKLRMSHKPNFNIVVNNIKLSTEAIKMSA